MTVKLRENGLNLPEWRKDLMEVTVMKNMEVCLDTKLPKTRGDSVAKNIIAGSIPERLANASRKFGSAAKMLEWIVKQFEGGRGHVATRGD
jgi:hypothetical protein